MERAYQGVREGIAGAATPQNVVACRLCEAVQARLESRIAQGKSGGLSEEENSELEHYEHLMRLAKARARRWEW